VFILFFFFILYAVIFCSVSNKNEQLVDGCEKNGKEATFTEIWYTFVDPKATAVDERGSEDAHKAVGILILKNSKREKASI
jgi:hypothetical protein